MTKPYKSPKFFISKVICECGNKIEDFEPRWFEQFDWLLICCDKCGHNSEYNMEMVHTYREECK